MMSLVQQICDGIYSFSEAISHQLHIEAIYEGWDTIDQHGNTIQHADKPQPTGIFGHVHAFLLGYLGCVLLTVRSYKSFNNICYHIMRLMISIGISKTIQRGNQNVKILMIALGAVSSTDHQRIEPLMALVRSLG